SVHGHDASAAEAEVVLQCGLDVLHLPLLGLPAQLPDQLGTLRQTGGSERVPLRQQTARWIHHPTAAVGGRLVFDQLLALALLAHAQTLVADQLVGAEAVVQLDDLDLVDADAGLLVDLLRGAFGHAHADHADAAASEVFELVGRHGHAADLDGP